MQKQVSPVAFIAVIACAVIVLGVVMWKAAVGKPSYRGQNAGHPGQGPMTNPHAGMSADEARKAGIGSIPGGGSGPGR